MRSRLFSAITLLGALFLMAVSSLPAAHAQTTAAPPEAAQRLIDNDRAASNRLQIGPDIGIFLPSSSKTRDRFGASWLSLGIGIGQIETVKTKSTLGLDLHVLYQQRGDHHAFFLPLGIGYRVGFQAGAGILPYAGASADLILADLRSTEDNVHSGLRTGTGASAFVGVNFGTSGNLEARYYAASSIKSFDLSGLSLSAGYRF